MSVTFTNASAGLVDARPISFWLDRPNRPAPRPPLDGNIDTDLAVVGGGYCGLWTAILAKERDPSRDVVVIESNRIGWAASGRNGGFCNVSLTHGRDNGFARFPDEFDTIDQLGRQNRDELRESLDRYGIDCSYESPGILQVATQPYQIEDIRRRPGEFLDRDAVRAEINSESYLAGVWNRSDADLLDPAALAWGLADSAEALGVRVADGTHVTRLGTDGAGMRICTAGGPTVRTRQVALATNAFPAVVRRLRLYTVPVYDYVLVTEPLTPDQQASVGWCNRQGVEDIGNQFHYYRPTPDGRILWGGYDAIYHYGRKVRPESDQRLESFTTLSRQFFETFPQLRGLGFTHRWGGAIDTCTRFFAFQGTTHSGRVAYSLGYTGLGVAATRFGANVMLDLLEGRPTERTNLAMVRSKPIPFPPEPLAFLGIEATRRSLATADRTEGKRNLWLRSLDRLGLGFDS